MSNRKLEDLVNAIATYNGTRDPLHPGYQARNMLCLQAFTDEGIATGKLRIFDSVHGGFLACVYDLKIKCSGKSRANLRGENFTIQGLVRVYSMPDASANFICKFLRKALNEPSINPETRLDYFLTEDSAQAEKVVKEKIYA
jgi:hypothetical protein